MKRLEYIYLLIDSVIADLKIVFIIACLVLFPIVFPDLLERFSLCLVGCFVIFVLQLIIKLLLVIQVEDVSCHAALLLDHLKRLSIPFHAFVDDSLECDRSF